MNHIHHWICSSTLRRNTLPQRVPRVLDGTELGDDVLEIGPGPGLDPRTAQALRSRQSGGNVEVVTGNAAAMPFADAAKSDESCTPRQTGGLRQLAQRTHARDSSW